MSQEYIDYNAFIAGWSDATDAQIESMLKEMTDLVALGDYDYETPVNDVINNLVTQAEDAEALAITADATAMLADAAAVSAAFSFGLGMVAFVGLEAESILERQLFLAASKDLQKAVQNADTTMAAAMSPEVSDYVATFKANNTTFLELAPKGMNQRQMRSAMLQFMLNATSYYKKKGKDLTVDRFRTAVESARRFSNSDEYNAILDTLDDINLSESNDEKSDNLIKLLGQMQTTLKNYSLGMEFTLFGLMGTLYKKLNVSREELTSAADRIGATEEIATSEVFAGLEFSGKAIATFGFILAIADVVINIIDIVNIVDQMKDFISKLKGDVKQYYLNYFKGIKDLATTFDQYVNTDSTS